MLLHAQIEANKRKTVLLVSVFLLLFVAAGGALGVVLWDNEVMGIVVAALLGVLYVLLMTSQGTQVIMALNRAREIKSEDEHPSCGTPWKPWPSPPGCPCPRCTSSTIRAPTRLPPA